MEVWQAVILGAVQGLAEFLPISSSGHLMLLQKLFGIENNALFYSVMLHMGTLVPVLIVLKDKIKGLFVKPFSLLKNLIIATIPAGLVGFIISRLFDLDSLFYNHIWLLGASFLFTAIMLLVAEITNKKSYKKPLEKGSALVMGLGQMVGIIPGISRSGLTMSFGCFSKVNNQENAQFTFLMSVPIILAAAILSGVDVIESGSIGDISVLPLVTGMLSSAIFGYIAITFMMNIIRKAKFHYFSIYLVLLSIFTFFI